MTLERNLQRKCIRWLESKGCYCIKMETQHRRGIPDVLVLFPWGSYCFIEYKVKGGRILPIQYKVHQTLAEKVQAIVAVAHSLPETQEVYKVMLARCSYERRKMWEEERGD